MWKDKLKAQVEDNPIAAIGAAALAATAIAKVIDSVSAAKGRRAYAKQVNYRVKNKK